MNAHWKRYIGFFAICLAGTAGAYERATHAAITYNAIQLSGLNFANGNLLQNLGLDVQTQLLDVGTFGSDYLDIVTLPSPKFPVGASSSLLPFGFYEMKVMNYGNVPINFDLPFWVMCGVIREDDTPGD